MEEKKSKGLNIFIKILIVIAVLWVLLRVVSFLFSIFLVNNIMNDSKLSASRTEANYILSGINQYCQRESIEFESNKEKLCDSNMTQEDISKMTDLGDVEIIEASYSNDKLTKLKLKTQYGHTFELQNKEMIKVD